MKISKDQSFAYHRKRTKDNLVWIVIIVVLLVFACSCSTQRGGCQMTRGYVGYGNR